MFQNFYFRPFVFAIHHFALRSHLGIERVTCLSTVFNSQLICIAQTHWQINCTPNRYRSHIQTMRNEHGVLCQKIFNYVPTEISLTHFGPGNDNCWIQYATLSMCAVRLNAIASHFHEHHLRDKIVLKISNIPMMHLFSVTEFFCFFLFQTASIWFSSWMEWLLNFTVLLWHIYACIVVCLCSSMAQWNVMLISSLNH